MFALKKILAALLMPLPLMLLTGLTGLLLLWFGRHRQSGALLILLAFAGIFLASFHPLSATLLAGMERQYSGYRQEATGVAVDLVMVLGHGHSTQPEQPITSRLSRTALTRLAEGIRIYRMHPGARLVLSGYSGATAISQARMMARAAQSLGVDPGDMILLETPRNTREEARQAATITGRKTLVVVTSASHMPRAMVEFRQQGLDPIAAPTDFLSSDDPRRLWNYTPQARYLEQTELFWRETLGQWWQKLSRWLSREP